MRIIPEWREYDEEIKTLLATPPDASTHASSSSGDVDDDGDDEGEDEGGRPPSIRPPYAKEKHGGEL